MADDVYTPNIISNMIRDVPIPLPDVQRIENVHEFMSNPDNYSGDIKALTDRLDGKVNECQHVMNLLYTAASQKNEALNQLNGDLLQLQCQLGLPNAMERFVEKDEKIVIKFMDEETTHEYDLETALDAISVKMSCLFSEIVVTGNDIDVVEHLQNIAMANCNSVKDWLKSNQRSEEVNQSTSC